MANWDDDDESDDDNDVNDDDGDPSSLVVRTDESTSTCTCQRCTDPGTPYHPSELTGSKIAVAHQKTGGPTKDVYKEDTTKLVHKVPLDFYLYI